jgi:uncharacterized protein (UPF0335 family)
LGAAKILGRANVAKSNDEKRISKPERIAGERKDVKQKREDVMNDR